MTRMVVDRPSITDKFRTSIVIEKPLVIFIVAGIIVYIYFKGIPQVDALDTSSPEIIYGLIALVLAVLGLALLYFTDVISANRSFRRVISMIHITGNSIVFSKPVDVEIGVVRITGFYTRNLLSPRSGKTYRVMVEYSGRRKITATTRISLNDLRGGYTIIADSTGRGLIRAPALRISSSGLDKTYIPLIDPQQGTCSEESYIMLVRDNDIAEVRLRLMKGVIEGNVVFAGTKARRVRVQLISCIETGEAAGGISVRPVCISKNIFETDKTISFRIKSKLAEPVVVITYKDTASIRNILKKIGLESPVSEGYMDGEHRIQLILDYPYTRDYSAEEKLVTTTCKEQLL